MRQIKFRGRRTDNGEWIYGDFCNHLFEYEKETKPCIHIANKGYIRNGIYEIDPSTVGQFTGLKDCEGKDIYEGDIVEYFDDIEEEMRSGVVRYYDDYCSFNIDDQERDPIGLIKTWTYRVIGTIHERKEE